MPPPIFAEDRRQLGPLRAEPRTSRHRRRLRRSWCRSCARESDAYGAGSRNASGGRARGDATATGRRAVYSVGLSCVENHEVLSYELSFIVQAVEVGVFVHVGST
eukprot:6319825-Pyramimonas_sp.AAC.1